MLAHLGSPSTEGIGLRTTHTQATRLFGPCRREGGDRCYHFFGKTVGDCERCSPEMVGIRMLAGKRRYLHMALAKEGIPPIVRQVGAGNFQRVSPIATEQGQSDGVIYLVPDMNRKPTGCASESGTETGDAAVCVAGCPRAVVSRVGCFILDTGSGHDIVGLEDVVYCVSSIIQAPKPMGFATVNGTTRGCRAIRLKV